MTSAMGELLLTTVFAPINFIAGGVLVLTLIILFLYMFYLLLEG